MNNGIIDNEIFTDIKHKLILQGEVGIHQGYDFIDIKLHTSRPKTCTIVTLHEKEHKISVLAHIDDYTCVDHLFYNIKEYISLRISNYHYEQLQFEANILGGTDEKFSAAQQKKVIERLKEKNIPYTKVDLGKGRPQVVMDAYTGKVNLLYNEGIDYRLEYLQLREYYCFNHLFLDQEYPGVKGEDIPEFESLRAIRSIGDIANIQIKNLSKKSLQSCQKREEKNPLCITSWRRTAVITKENAKNQLQQLLATQFQKVKCLNSSFEEEKFDLLLRQSCCDKKYVDLTKLLFKLRYPLNIDLSAKGKTSGTAFDVAEKFNNAEATEVLGGF